jgi:hypothetical protein
MRYCHASLGTERLTCVGIALILLAWFHYPRYRIDDKSYEELQGLLGEKVTLAQVETILGGPAHRYGSFETAGPNIPGTVTLSDFLFGDKKGWHWENEQMSIFVYIDDNGCLTGLTRRAKQKSVQKK